MLNKTKHLLTISCLFLSLSAFSQQIIVEESSGMQHVLEIQPTDAFVLRDGDCASKSFP